MPTESMLLSAHAESIIISAGAAVSMMFSACAKGVILSALPTESMMLSTPFDCVLMLTEAGGYKKNNNRRY